MRPELRWLAIGLLLAGSTLQARTKQNATPAAMSHEGSLNLALAINYLEAGLLDRALDRANRAAASDGKSPDVHTVMAMILDRSGQQEKAAEAFAMALKYGPEEGTFNNAYGAWLCQHRSPAEGQPYLRKAEANPGRQLLRNILLNAGNCALLAGEFAEAEQKLRLVLQAAPADARALLQLARVKHAQGQHFEARAFLQRREALGPLGADALELAIEIETGAGDAKAAERYRTLLREQHPDHVTPTGEGAGRP